MSQAGMLKKIIVYAMVFSMLMTYSNVVVAWAATPPAQSTNDVNMAEQQCDNFANSPLDPLKVGVGVADGQIRVADALPACQKAALLNPSPHYLFLYGRALEAAKQFHAAIQQYEKSAAGGYSAAMNALGYMYESGRGTLPSTNWAAEWFTKAAEAGNPDAMNNVGVLEESNAVLFGSRLYRVDKEAVTWYRKAADAGSRDGMFNLGVMYELGHGVPQSYTNALAWYTKAADAGEPRAMNNLGVLYEYGEGVPKSDATALAWYRKGAEAGGGLAMYNLGLHLRKGKGVKRDEPEAMRLFIKCGNDIHSDARPGCAEQVGRGYFDGLGGGVQDYDAARKWFTVAANGNDAWGDIYLGILYQNGWSVQRDPDAAIKFYTRASDCDDPRTAKVATNLKKRLEDSQHASGALLLAAIVAAVGLIAAASSQPGSQTPSELEKSESEKSFYEELEERSEETQRKVADAQVRFEEERLIGLPVPF